MVGVPLIALSGSDGVDPATTVMASDDVDLRLSRIERQRASRSTPAPVVAEPVADESQATAQAAPEPEPETTTTTVKRTTTTTTKATSTTTTAKPTTTTTAKATTTTTAKPTTTTTAAPTQASSTGNVQEGNASYYDNAPAGTCAHRTAPMGTILKVTNLANGKSTTCKVADRGPYIAGRVVDLSKPTFAEIAPLSAGVIKVRVEW
jgi:rare lipoprotein A